MGLAALFYRFLPARNLGKAGEQAAVRFLKSKGHQIIETNFAIRHGEIDIISVHDSYLVFTEVKSRSADAWIDPLYAVTPQKIQRILRTANTYRRVRNMLERQPRFDIVTVIFEGKRPKIQHVENAFHFTKNH